METTLNGAGGCIGDIANDNGHLFCRRNEEPPGPERVPLVAFFRAWFDYERFPAPRIDQDIYTTTNPQWTCIVFHTCETLPDPAYEPIGLMGYVFNPRRPQPAGTVPLFQWWNPSQNDHYLTTTSRERDTFIDIEGYIPSAFPSAEAVELVSFYDQNLSDYATLNPRTLYERVVLVDYARIRREGFLLGPGTPGGVRCRASQPPVYSRQSPGGNLDREFTWGDPAFDFIQGDAVRIRASGSYSVGLGVMFDIRGSGTIAGPSYPLATAPMYSLIGKVTDGRMWVSGVGNFEAGFFFPIGGDSGCMEHTTDTLSGSLVLAVNDMDPSDNRNGNVDITVSKWR